MDEAIREGIRLFNSQKFFEAHEALEAVWLKAQGEEKTLLHGLIQVAAAFHHFTRRNLTGFQSLLEKGVTKIESYGGSGGGISLQEFLAQLQPWRELTQRAGERQPSVNPEEVVRLQPPPFPKIPVAPSG